MRRKNFSLLNLSSRLVGKSYKLGSFDEAKGMDCLSLMATYVESLGVELPDEFMGVNRENYKDLWEEDEEKSVELYLKWIQSFADEVDEDYIRPGDILVLKSRKDSSTGFGIYGGSRRVFSVFVNSGVDILELSLFRIRKVYRVK